MKIYKKIIFDKDNNVIFEDSFFYEGDLSLAGIHYDYKSTRGAKAMKKKAEREKRLAERKAKRALKNNFEAKKDDEKMIPVDQVITLSDITDPDKK